jgi:hypothetical protein
MKNSTTFFLRSIALAALVFVASCGLQVRSNPAVITPPGSPSTGGEKLYTVSGHAIGVRYTADDPDVPTGYYPNLPTHVMLSINGVPFALNVNDTFTFDHKLKSGEDFEIAVLTNGIEVPNIDGITPSIYLNCAISNPTGTIVDQDIIVHEPITELDIIVRCYLSDAPFHG